MPSPGLFSFCWFILSNIDMIIFVLSYILFVIFYYYLLEACLFFSNERQKVDLYRRSRRRGKCNQDRLHEKKIYFQR